MRSPNEFTRCPHCGIESRPSTQKLNNMHFPNRENYQVLYLHECPGCNSQFITIQDRAIGSEGFLLTLIKYPTETLPFTDSIRHLSPEFTKIYNQAFCAEQLGLHDICGMGYRKAVEFLIKDYCILEHQESEEEIKPMLLSQVISKYISDNQVKTLASRCAWLGNDEAHYVRLHTDRSFEDLKVFIHALIQYIEWQRTYEDAASIDRK